MARRKRVSIYRVTCDRFFWLSVSGLVSNAFKSWKKSHKANLRGLECWLSEVVKDVESKGVPLTRRQTVVLSELRCELAFHAARVFDVADELLVEFGLDVWEVEAIRTKQEERIKANV